MAGTGTPGVAGWIAAYVCALAAPGVPKDLIPVPDKEFLETLERIARYAPPAIAAQVILLIAVIFAIGLAALVATDAFRVVRREQGLQSKTLNLMERELRRGRGGLGGGDQGPVNDDDDDDEPK